MTIYKRFRTGCCIEDAFGFQFEDNLALFFRFIFTLMYIYFYLLYENWWALGLPLKKKIVFTIRVTKSIKNITMQKISMWNNKAK
jgi:hypothetical protein